MISLGRALVRLGEIREIADDLPQIDSLPPGKVAALARFASAAKAQAVTRLPDDRRTATLLAFVHTLKASAGDDVIDLLDAIVTTMFAQAEAGSKEARLRSLCDLDAAALKLRDAGGVILGQATPDAEVRAVVFALIGRDAHPGPPARGHRGRQGEGRLQGTAGDVQSRQDRCPAEGRARSHGDRPGGGRQAGERLQGPQGRWGCLTSSMLLHANSKPIPRSRQ